MRYYFIEFRDSLNYLLIYINANACWLCQAMVTCMTVFSKLLHYLENVAKKIISHAIL